MVKMLPTSACLSMALLLCGCNPLMRASWYTLETSVTGPAPINVTRAQVDAVRTRKLLLNAREIDKLAAAVQQKGYACVCLSWYWSKHLVKCEIALGKGKKEYDKRDTERERDSNRELHRAVRNKGKEE